jgi:hypothetical protein
MSFMSLPNESVPNLERLLVGLLTLGPFSISADALRGRYAKGVDWGGIQSGVPTVGRRACHSTPDWVKNALTRDTSVGVSSRCAGL